MRLVSRKTDLVVSQLYPTEQVNHQDIKSHLLQTKNVLINLLKNHRQEKWVLSLWNLPER